MHELSVASEILELIAAKIDDRASVTKVFMSIGPLAGISNDALTFGFEMLAPQEGFVNASMTINAVPARLRCERCGRRYELEDMELPCPACESMEREVLSGFEFSVDSVEVED
jgi:hydrogenase nickel incorporation protein HypA/HybF